MTDLVYDSISKYLFHGCDWINEKTAHFCDVYGDGITQLVFDGVVDLNDRATRYAPSNEEVIKFLNNHPAFSCHGSVSVNDGEPKVVIEGMYSASFTSGDRYDFLKFTAFSDIVRVIAYPTILYNRW